MYVGNSFVASVWLNPLLICQPGYIGKHKRELIKKYVENRACLEEQTEFFIIASR